MSLFGVVLTSSPCLPPRVPFLSVRSRNFSLPRQVHVQRSRPLPLDSSPIENNLVKILNGYRENLTSFGSGRFRSREPSGQALIKGLASTLTGLHIMNCSPDFGSVMMKIFSSCPHLVVVRCSGYISWELSTASQRRAIVTMEL